MTGQVAGTALWCAAGSSPLAGVLDRTVAPQAAYIPIPETSLSMDIKYPGSSIHSFRGQRHPQGTEMQPYTLQSSNMIPAGTGPQKLPQEASCELPQPHPALGTGSGFTAPLVP